MKSHFLSLTVVVLLSTAQLLAKAPIKFGKVSIEELQMTHYDLDSSAAAVVLCDYGYFNLQDYSFTRTVRIKILKKEGLYLADDIYPGAEKTEIKGKTFTLENGEIVETKLKRESTFRERVTEDYYRLRVAMPNVKVGSVFDIEFTQSFPPPVWYFQKEIPVKWSELIMPQSRYFDMKRKFTGYETLYINSSNRWVAKDMPAFKKEPYINSVDNYITKFDIEMKSIAIPGVYYKEYATNWNAVARRLGESDYFGGNINAALYLREIAKSIEEKSSSDIEKLEYAYEAIKENVKWNKSRNLYCTYSTLGKSFSEGIGNSADINIILINLLKKLDIMAHPVILSTRDNGLLSTFSASMNKLNYVIVYAKIGEKEFFIDATEEDLPLGMLPRRCLNGIGQMIIGETAKLVYIKPDEIDKTTEMLILDLKDDNSLSGTYVSKREGYDAFDTRTNYKSFNGLDEFVDNIEDSYSSLKLKNYKIENIDNLDQAVKETCEIEIQNMAFEMDGNIYLNPLLHLQMAENPFKLEERQYPVDFTVPKTIFYNLTINLPEGYRVQEVPQPMRMGLPEQSAIVTYNIQAIGNKINIVYKLDVRKPVFYANEYKLLKEFYSQIIEKHSEPVIIKKS